MEVNVKEAKMGLCRSTGNICFHIGISLEFELPETYAYVN